MVPFVVLIALVSALSGTSAYTPLSHKEYEALNNPARGVVGHQDINLSNSGSGVSVGAINWAVQNNKPFQQATVYLDTRVDGSPLSDADLNVLDTSFAMYRTAGVKVALRFAYTASDKVEPFEPAEDKLIAQVSQIKPVLEKYKDVIYMVQQGFIGSWGEQYYTTNFGTNAQVSSEQWASRNRVAEAILNATPGVTWASMRTPQIKDNFIGGLTPVTADQAFGTSKAARIGHHNDCVFGNEDDQGSYREKDWDGPDHKYVRADSAFTPRGGEVCGDPPKNAELYACSRALKVLSEEHWSYINLWKPEVYDAAWTAQGCYDEIRGRLGYRYELGANASGNAVALTNKGFASAMQAYTAGVLLVPKDAALAKGQNVAGYYAKLDIDLRKVGAGQSVDIPLNFCLGSSSGKRKRSRTGKVCPTPTPAPGGAYDAFFTISDDLVPNKASFRILVSNTETTQGPQWAKDARVNALGAARIGGSGCLNVVPRTVSISADGDLTF